MNLLACRVHRCCVVWLLAWLCCQAQAETNNHYSEAAETAVTYLPLSGPVADREAELSALDWCGEQLVMVPQYLNFDDHSNHQQGHWYQLAKQSVIDYLAAIDAGQKPAQLVPAAIPVTQIDKLEALPGYDGIEAFVCVGDEAFIAVEIDRWGTREATVPARLVKTDAGWQVEEVGERLKSLSGIGNKGNEALLLTEQGLISIHEINSERFQGHTPQALRLNKKLKPVAKVAMAEIPYRLTDATQLDAEGKFWVSNYQWRGDSDLRQPVDPFWQQFGQGASHVHSEDVERLIELQWTGQEIVFTGRPPIDLQLIAESGRNWEGIVRLDQRGFLLVTDKYPATLLGFVPLSANTYKP